MRLRRCEAFFVLMTNNPPIAISIAGYDCSAGAGVLADTKVFQSLGVFGLAATTAIVAQRPGHVGQIQWLEPDLFQAQLDELGVYPLAAVKIGMLGSESILKLTCRFIDKRPNVPVVLDPVLKASAGVSLSESDFIQSLKKDLLPRVTLVTPNRDEAEVLLGRTIDPSTDAIKAACRELVSTYECSVLLKGGHFESEQETTDYLCAIDDRETIQEFRLPNLDVPDLHGTGCHLSSAICAFLAKGEPMDRAIRKAKQHLHQAMAEHYQWLGSGESIEALADFKPE